MLKAMLCLVYCWHRFGHVEIASETVNLNEIGLAIGCVCEDKSLVLDCHRLRGHRSLRGCLRDLPDQGLAAQQTVALVLSHGAGV